MKPLEMKKCVMNIILRTFEKYGTLYIRFYPIKHGGADGGALDL